MKADYYEIYATVNMKYKVVFDEPVTFEEAREMFIDDEYADIVDEEPLGIVTIDRVIQVGVE